VCLGIFNRLESLRAMGRLESMRFSGHTADTLAVPTQVSFHSDAIKPSASPFGRMDTGNSIGSAASQLSDDDFKTVSRNNLLEVVTEVFR
jgi:hypothetical protein